MILDQKIADCDLQPLTGEVRRIVDVSHRERNEMLRLMQGFYKNATKGKFESDFFQKDWVILARHPDDGRIQGFSTQMVYSVQTDDRTIRVLFSGDTIIHPNYWARNPLARLWGQLALALIDDPSTGPLYWFLISKGYKTYRFLPVFFREFFPRYDCDTPTWAARLIKEIAVQRFNTAYDSSQGVIRGNENACRLRESVADVTPDRCKDPHIEFFAKINPGHTLGDELCCLAPLKRDNFNKLAYRVIGTTNPEIEKLVRTLRPG